MDAITRRRNDSEVALLARYFAASSSGSLAIFVATLLSSSSFALLIADPRIGRHGKCPVRRLLHVVRTINEIVASTIAARQAAKNAFTVATPFP